MLTNKNFEDKIIISSNPCRCDMWQGYFYVYEGGGEMDVEHGEDIKPPERIVKGFGRLKSRSFFCHDLYS